MTDKELVYKLGGQTKLAREINKRLNKSEGTKGVAYVSKGQVAQWIVRDCVAEKYKLIVSQVAEKMNVVLPKAFLSPVSKLKVVT